MLVLGGCAFVYGGVGFVRDGWVARFRGPGERCSSPAAP
ncbi:hypothetical protein Natoc_0877 [Natronococcus occultus SP4]|uniref:Uncharacterized protein n=1 Tax=Natronococcus occultus SP4 TaxID=694430 RepID=L0JVB9_9EURY|nr:hypothetical protein Natoc_0877 [Natronococcus occultus SP4]